jgi:hypothetical protein
MKAFLHVDLKAFTPIDLKAFERKRFEVTRWRLLRPPPAL